MNLNDLIDRDDLARALDDKLITIRHSYDGQAIYNYSDAALYTPGAWDNPAVRQCRGLIVDGQDGRVVARPWAKFFNHGQVEAGVLDMTAPVEVTDKLDGSLGIIHYDASGRLRVATRGSFESEQAKHATDWLRARTAMFGLDSVQRITPLVEIIYPGNRIVCDYGDRDELVLLGGVDIESGAYLGPELTAAVIGWTHALTDTFPFATLRDALAAPPRTGAEGLCVRFLNEPRIVKIKQDDYIRLHRIVTGLSERSVWEHMVAEKPLGELLGTLPDELHDWTQRVWYDLAARLDVTHGRAIDTHRRIVRALGFEWERRDYATQAMRHPELRPYLFQLLDGKNPRPSILRTLKPAGDTRPRTYTEATA